MLREFHETIGRLVQRFEATVGFLEGDGVELFFNDPIEIPDAPLRAVRLGCALREEMVGLTERWRKRGYMVDFGANIRHRLRDLRRGRLRAGGSDCAAIGECLHKPRFTTRGRSHRRTGADHTATECGGGGHDRGGSWRANSSRKLQPPVTAFDVVNVRHPVPRLSPSCALAWASVFSPGSRKQSGCDLLRQHHARLRQHLLHQGSPRVWSTAIPKDPPRTLRTAPRRVEAAYRTTGLERLDGITTSCARGR